tara:strand:+ start:59 stop:235 length:177 start_codon:yes stop_codon:yes gene_type:complete
MKLALIINKHSYAGREYLSKLCNEIKFEIQDESIANYRSYIGQKKLESLKKSLNKLSQ